MMTGDFVRLHIHPGRSEVLDLPESIGVIQAVDTASEQTSLLIHFASMSVYVSAISAEEVEIVDPDDARRAEMTRDADPDDFVVEGFGARPASFRKTVM